MEPIVLNKEIIMVLAIIGLAVFLFIVEWIRVDMVAILMTVLGYNLLGEGIRDSLDPRLRE